MDDIYNEGYHDYQSGFKEWENPYIGLEAEYWTDGWTDAEEDESQ